MSLVDALTDKPWQDNSPDKGRKASETLKVRRVGLRVLLAVVTMLFFLFFVAFLMRSQYPDWQPLAEEPAHPLFDQSILWLNSFYLLFASILVEVARRTVLKSSQTVTRISLVLGGLFSVAFVAGQLLFWQQLYSQGFSVDVNPALSFFYLFTGLHAAHVGLGVLVWIAALFVTFKGSIKRQEYIELCAIYWHFLLGLWFALFALLVSKPETYDAIAAFCGLR